MQCNAGTMNVVLKVRKEARKLEKSEIWMRGASFTVFLLQQVLGVEDRDYISIIRGYRYRAIRNRQKSFSPLVLGSTLGVTVTISNL